MIHIQKTENIDNAITDLMATLARKQASYAEGKRHAARPWITNGSFQLMGFPPVNIQTASEETILWVVAQVFQHRDYNRRAAEEMGITSISGKVSGYGYETWLDDCKKRISVIYQNIEKAKLNELETRLNAIVSPELRRQLEVDAITKELNV